MPQFKIFISSVQKEFAKEREALYQHFKTDALLSGFFEPVLFEHLPAASQTPNKVYKTELAQSQIYLGLFGMVILWRPAVSKTDHVTDYVTDHVTDQVTDQVEELIYWLLLVMTGEKSRTELMDFLNLRLKKQLVKRHGK